MNKQVTLMLLLLSATLHLSAQTLTRLWETDTLLRVPESVLFDAKSSVLYVANIDGKSDAKDGQGFISKVSTDGKIITLQWVAGLDAPKGMGLFKNTLYVADLTRVVAIDVAKGAIVSRTEIEGAKFLNDITVDAKGNVYVSDSATGKIHLLQNGKAGLYFESTEFSRLNGLLALKDALYIADAGTGKLYSLTWGTKILTKLSDVAPKGNDGIVPTGKNEFIVSCWAGEVYFVDAAGKSLRILDTKDQGVNSADVDYDPKTKTLFVPTFSAHTVTAYRFTR